MTKKASTKINAWGGADISAYFTFGNSSFGVSDKNRLIIYHGYTEDFTGEDDNFDAPSWGFHLVTAESAVTAKIERAMQRKNEVQLLSAMSKSADLWTSMLAYNLEFSELLSDLLSQCKDAGLKIKSSPFKTYKPIGTIKGYKIRDGIKTVIRR